MWHAVVILLVYGDLFSSLFLIKIRAYVYTKLHARTGANRSVESIRYVYSDYSSAIDSTPVSFFPVTLGNFGRPFLCLRGKEIIFAMENEQAKFGFHLLSHLTKTLLFFKVLVFLLVFFATYLCHLSASAFSSIASNSPSHQWLSIQPGLHGSMTTYIPFRTILPDLAFILMNPNFFSTPSYPCPEFLNELSN